MPKDLYQWEKSGALAHHCPACEDPLSNPNALKTCVGIHVEPCKRYHTQLFMIGTSERCDPCHREDNERAKRHRKIAELIRDLKALKEVDDAPDSEKAADSGVETDENKERSPAPKKSKPKTTKKGKKILPRAPRAVTTAEIELVTTVLRPGDAEDDDEGLEGQLLDDADTKANRAYHAGTSNRRAIRVELIKKEKTSRNKKEDNTINDKELDGYLQVLDVPPLVKGASKEEKALYSELKNAINADLEQAAREREAMIQRKAGFWRWANAKTFKRLAERKQSSGGKGCESDDTSNSNSADTSGEVTDETDYAEYETDWTEFETETTNISDHEESANDLAVNGLIITDTEESHAVDPNPTTNTAVIESTAGDDDSWTTVGKKPKLKQTPTPGKITMVSNGGLKQFVSPVTKGRKR